VLLLLLLYIRRWLGFATSFLLCSTLLAVASPPSRLPLAFLFLDLSSRSTLERRIPADENAVRVSGAGEDLTRSLVSPNLHCLPWMIHPPAGCFGILAQQDGRSTHGGWRAALVRAGPPALALAGLVSVAVGGFSCRLFVVERGDSPYASGYYAEQSDGGSCVPFSVLGRTPSEEEKGGRALAIVSTIVGGLGFLAMAYAADQTARLQCHPDTVAVAAVLALVVAALSLGVAFIGLSGDTCDSYDCVPGGMAYLVLFGAFCWAGAGGLMCHVYQQMKKQEREEKEEEEQTSKDRARSSESNGRGEAACEVIPVASGGGAAGTRTKTATAVETDNCYGTRSTIRTAAVTGCDEDGSKAVERTVERC
jgi:hypothetical protein